MNIYKEIQPAVKVQLKGNRLRLFAYLCLISFLFMLITEGLPYIMNEGESFYAIVSFFLSLSSMVVNAAFIFMFLNCIRKENRKGIDIKYACKKAYLLIVTGIITSMIQMAFLFLITFTSAIPPLFILLYAILTIVFMLWNALIFFSIYDGNMKFTEFFLGSLQLLMKFIWPFLIASSFYILWTAIGQIVLPIIMETVFHDASIAGLLLAPLQMVDSVGIVVAFLMSCLTIVFYVVQFAFLIPIYTFLANVYEKQRKTFMPSGTRFDKGVIKK